MRVGAVVAISEIENLDVNVLKNVSKISRKVPMNFLSSQHSTFCNGRHLEMDKLCHCYFLSEKDCWSIFSCAVALFSTGTGCFFVIFNVKTEFF